ncbi:MAG: hypothetical protein HDR13_07045 [Lachnospiraceae bacterium]|nr:hypothetical protein [Lachnospiraceae bacterium]
MVLETKRLMSRPVEAVDEAAFIDMAADGSSIRTSMMTRRKCISFMK